MLTSIYETTQGRIPTVPLSSERNFSLQEACSLSPVYSFFSELGTQLQGKTNFANLNLSYILVRIKENNCK
jgi:hypothetical protein